MTPPFFITGLPRSRTAWLANLFTWGDSFCYHDILGECGSLSELDSKIGECSSRFVGVSDSSILLVWTHLLRRYPTAKWIIVKRDFDQACDSFVSYFRQHPYPGMPPISHHLASSVLWDFHWELGEIEACLKLNIPNLVRVVNFEDLADYHVCRRLVRDVTHEYLSEQRWKLLNGLRINTLSEIRALPENPKFNQLLNECVLAGNGIDAARGATAQCGAGSPLSERHAAELVHNESR